MDCEPDVTRLDLRATSVADDLGFVALADIAELLKGQPYRVIGGHMVTLLVARWGLGRELYRATGDTDLGVPPVVVNQPTLINALIERGYRKIDGNRFSRDVTDLPSLQLGHESSERSALVDVLVPAYTSRARQNRRFGDHLVTTEVPGLAVALQRPAVAIDVEMRRLNGERLVASLLLPDEIAALVLKVGATRVRDKATDLVDIWRCLEVANAAGVKPRHFTAEEELQAAEHIRSLFASNTSTGIIAIVNEQGLSETGAARRLTRIRALIERVLP